MVSSIFARDKNSYLEVSTVHGQTVENNSLNTYGRLSWTVNILGRQRFVNGP